MYGKVIIEQCNNATYNAYIWDVVAYPFYIDCRLYLALGVLWIILSVASRILQGFALGLFPGEWQLEVMWGDATIDQKLLVPLAAVCIVGFLFFDLVYLAAVVNYSIQSVFNIKYIRAVTEMIAGKNQKYSNLDIAIKVCNTLHSVSEWIEGACLNFCNQRGYMVLKYQLETSVAFYPRLKLVFENCISYMLLPAEKPPLQPERSMKVNQWANLV